MPRKYSVEFKEKAVHQIGVTLCLLTLDEAGLSGWEGCWKTRE